MFKVCGISKVDFVGREGNHIVGTKVYLTFEGDNIDGFGTESVFFGSQLEVPTLNSCIDLTYNKYGKVSGFSYVD